MMDRKIIGILVTALLIATALPSISGGVEKDVISNEIPSPEFVPGEFIVKFKDKPSSRVSIDNLNEKYHVSSVEKVFRNSRNTILDNIYKFSVSEDSDILSIVDDYSFHPYVEYAEPNGIAYLCAIPNDENFSKQWHLDNIGQTGGTLDADIDAPEAWDVETGSPDIVIAIVDSGVDYTHPEFKLE